MSDRALSVIEKGTIESRSDSFNLLKSPGDFVVVQRGVPRLMVLRCPCGCGDDLMINLDTRSGPAWRLYNMKGAHTLYPSYWRDTACGSHFIVWKNRILWCNRSEEDYDWSVPKETEEMVLQRLMTEKFTHYTDIADDCDLVPWDCLQACKQLVRQGFATASPGRDSGYFKKKE